MSLRVRQGKEDKETHGPKESVRRKSQRKILRSRSRWLDLHFRNVAFSTIWRDEIEGS